MYTELQVTSYYSFLRGASSIEELLSQAKLFGYESIAIADRNSLAGMARAHQRAKAAGIRLIVGCRVDLVCGTSVLIYPLDRAAYARLCQMLSIGKRAGKNACHLTWDDVTAHADGCLAILIPDQPDDGLQANLSRLKTTFGDRAYLAMTVRRQPGDAVRLNELSHMAQAARVPTVATGDVLYHDPRRRILQDVVTCIREGCTIDDAGFRRERFADRHLKTPAEMARLFERYPEAVARSGEIADRCRFSLSELRYQYPYETVPGRTAQDILQEHTWQGAEQRYRNGVPDKVAAQLRHELALIEDRSYAPYFLTVHNIVGYAKSKGILCQGRGSAANSAVCYVLGITSLDPTESNLLFERFISAARDEPPDIDVDFEHERREEVIQWIYQTYGRDRAALCATFARYRSRGAVRDVGKVLGLTEDVTAALSGQVWGWSREGVEVEHAQALNLNLSDRRLGLTLELARELIDFPRHMSQHPGGFVLTQDRLDTLVPVQPAAMANRQIIEWDKDDIEHLHFMKMDVLGLGMLGCMRRAFDLLHEHYQIKLDLATIPQDDAATYKMIQRADTIGVFQIESRAQMSMLPRMKPARLYDLVIEVAIVRPGPIQGDMVHPYLRRRENLEKPEYPTPELEEVLKRTLGVPLFQEQAMQVAMVCGGFSANEADELRRAMATFRTTEGVGHFRDKLVAGMRRNGYTQDFAERTFKQIEGFGSYGFPESHAASFALIAYASSWMKCHHPDVFGCALLNAQPMGFYAPAQIVRDARQHGVEVRPISVNHSCWDCTLEPAGRLHAIRLGLRMVKGLSRAEGDGIVDGRAASPYTTIAELRRRTRLDTSPLEHLAEADAFACLNATAPDHRHCKAKPKQSTVRHGECSSPEPWITSAKRPRNDGASGLTRREALWQVRALPATDLPLFADNEEFVEPTTQIAAMKPGREVVEDYRSTGLTLRRHPVGFLRHTLSKTGVTRSADLSCMRDGARVSVAGIVLVRQKPGSAKGIMFMTIEDETGHANLVIWPTVFAAQRRLILSSGMIACHGRLQREGIVIHVVAERLDDLSDMLRSVGSREAFPIRTGRGDGTKGASPDTRGIKVPTRDFR